MLAFSGGGDVIIHHPLVTPDAPHKQIADRPTADSDGLWKRRDRYLGAYGGLLPDFAPYRARPHDTIFTHCQLVNTPTHIHLQDQTDFHKTFIKKKKNNTSFAALKYYLEARNNDRDELNSRQDENLRNIRKNQRVNKCPRSPEVPRMVLFPFPCNGKNHFLPSITSRIWTTLYFFGFLT